MFTRNFFTSARRYIKDGQSIYIKLMTCCHFFQRDYHLLLKKRADATSAVDIFTERDTTYSSFQLIYIKDITDTMYYCEFHDLDAYFSGNIFLTN